MRKDQAKISKKPESWEEVNTDFMCHPSVHGAISKNAYERGKRDGQIEEYETIHDSAIDLNDFYSPQIEGIVKFRNKELEKRKGCN